jgi:hypothetical protein
MDGRSPSWVRQSVAMVTGAVARVRVLSGTKYRDKEVSRLEY